MQSQAVSHSNPQRLEPSAGALHVCRMDPAVAESVASLWRLTYPRMQFLRPEIYDADAYRAFLANAEFTHYVATVDEVAVGALIVRWEPRNRAAELYLTGVLRRWRGAAAGVLPRLYEFAESDFAAAATEYVFALTRPGNVFAQRFLERQQFVRVGITRGREIVRLPGGDLARDTYVYYERLLGGPLPVDDHVVLEGL
jgi:ribosomal protein S18 acetylase RimI-like enzyme